MGPEFPLGDDAGGQRPDKRAGQIGREKDV